MDRDGVGTLYVVATPIGNLEDITLRARRVLGEVDLVAAEDTRRTRQLLTHLGISKPMLSYYEPREEKSLPQIIERLESGQSVALVTDGGTPAISDPGYRLVRAAHEAQIPVIPVPGPSALVAALSAAGLPTDRVTFAGFLPAKAGARRAALEQLKDRSDTLVFYEAPGRLEKLLAEALEILGDREAVVHREITKLHEEQIRGTLSELVEKLAGKEIKGEVTVLIAGASAQEQELTEAQLEGLIRAELDAGRSVKDVAAGLARDLGVSRKRVYALALRIEGETK
jgi:16S rRNA (cytidine1402-2'-O)-methyltransferase